MAGKYGKSASETVGRVLHEQKRGKLKSGGSGRTVKSRKQAIAIALSEARRAGKKVPKVPAARKKAARKSKTSTSAALLNRARRATMAPTNATITSTPPCARSREPMVKRVVSAAPSEREYWGYHRYPKGTGTLTKT